MIGVPTDPAPQGCKEAGAVITTSLPADDETRKAAHSMPTRRPQQQHHWHRPEVIRVLTALRITPLLHREQM